MRRSLRRRAQPCGRRLLQRRAAAFTLVEIMAVVAIISVLVTLSVPAYQRIQRKARTTAVVNDFRVLAAAFDAYAQELGRWPADTAVGVTPPAMTALMNAGTFTRKTAIGGKYNWEFNQIHFGNRIQAAIAISPADGAPLPLDVAQLLALEAAIDGGAADLLGGTFRIGAGLVPLYVIQP